MQRLLQFTTIAAASIVILTTLLSLATLLADVWWIADLLSHFRPYYAVVLLGCVPFLLALSRP